MNRFYVNDDRKKPHPIHRVHMKMIILCTEPALMSKSICQIQNVGGSSEC